MLDLELTEEVGVVHIGAGPHAVVRQDCPVRVGCERMTDAKSPYSPVISICIDIAHLGD